MRVRHPAVRKSYLEHGTSAASRRKRGADAFVNVSWNEALDLVAAELTQQRSGFVTAVTAQLQQLSWQDIQTATGAGRDTYAAAAQALAALGAPVAPEAVDADDDAALGSRDAVIWLTHSHRFAAAGPIARLALAIHGGEAAEVLVALHADDGTENAEVQAMGAGDVGALVDAALAGYAPYLDAVRAAVAWSAISDGIPAARSAT